jgi:lysine-arginine-ornithine-binding protein
MAVYRGRGPTPDVNMRFVVRYSHLFCDRDAIVEREGRLLPVNGLQQSLERRTSAGRRGFGKLSISLNSNDEYRKRGVSMTLGFKSAVVAALTIAALWSGAALAQDKLRIATEGAYPPFNYKNPDGTLGGFDVDIANALCKSMQVECEVVAQEWDGIIPGLLAHRYDAIVASMSITDERKKSVDFTNPYYHTVGALAVAKPTTITGNSPDDLKGKTIGVQSSTTFSSLIEDRYKGSEVRQYGTVDDAMLDLAAGRVDAVMADKITLAEWLNKAGKDCCAFAGPDIKDSRYLGDGVGISLRQGEAPLKDRFNKALDAIVADGTYKTINAKYFPFSIY